MKFVKSLFPSSCLCFIGAPLLLCSAGSESEKWAHSSCWGVTTHSLSKQDVADRHSVNFRVTSLDSAFTFPFFLVVSAECRTICMSFGRFSICFIPMSFVEVTSWSVNHKQLTHHFLFDLHRFQICFVRLILSLLPCLAVLLDIVPLTWPSVVLIPQWWIEFISYLNRLCSEGWSKRSNKIFLPKLKSRLDHASCLRRSSFPSLCHLFSCYISLPLVFSSFHLAALCSLIAPSSFLVQTSSYESGWPFGWRCDLCPRFYHCRISFICFCFRCSFHISVISL